MADQKQKVLRITAEFRMGTRKVHNGRILDAYTRGIAALTEAVKGSMPDGNIDNVRSTLEWLYLYAHASDEYPGGLVFEEALIEVDDEKMDGHEVAPPQLVDVMNGYDAKP